MVGADVTLAAVGWLGFNPKSPHAPRALGFVLGAPSLLNELLAFRAQGLAPRFS